jgi:glycine dehydrogenase
MKLNAASEMMPLTWPETNLHPFVPYSQAQGYLQILEELRAYLKSVTGFD